MTSKRHVVEWRRRAENVAVEIARGLGSAWRGFDRTWGWMKLNILWVIVGLLGIMAMTVLVIGAIGWPSWNAPATPPNAPVSHFQPHPRVHTYPTHPERSHRDSEHSGLFGLFQLPIFHTGSVDNTSSHRGGAKKEPGPCEGKSSLIVHRGDTLWSLSHSTRQHPYRWVKLAWANHLHTPYRIFPGERLMS